MTVARIMVPSDIAVIPPDDEVVLWDRAGNVVRDRPRPVERKAEKAPSPPPREVSSTPKREVLVPAMTVEGVGFPPGKATLGEADRKMIESAVRRIGVERIAKVVVYGRADKTGPEDLNMELSRRRAEAVKNLLVSLGIPAKRIRTIALGETSDYPGDSEEARALNRSAKIIFYRKEEP